MCTHKYITLSSFPIFPASKTNTRTHPAQTCTSRPKRMGIKPPVSVWLVLSGSGTSLSHVNTEMTNVTNRENRESRRGTAMRLINNFSLLKTRCGVIPNEDIGKVAVNISTLNGTSFLFVGLNKGSNQKKAFIQYISYKENKVQLWISKKSSFLATSAWEEMVQKRRIKCKL